MGRAVRVGLGDAASPLDVLITDRQDLGDPIAVRVASRVRVILAVAAAAAASFVTIRDPGMTHLALVVGLLYLPWATVVLFSADRPGNRIALIGGPVGDLVLVTTAQLMVPRLGLLLLLGQAIVVAFAAYTWVDSSSWLLGLASVAATASAQSFIASDQRLTVGDVAIFAVSLAGLLTLVRRITSQQRGAAARSLRLESRADVMLAAVADAVLVMAERGEVVAHNASAQRVLDTGRSELIGQRCSAVLGLHVDAKPLSCETECALLCLPGGSTDVEVWRRRADGSRQPLLARATAVEGSSPREVVHSLRDITRLKQADEAKTLFLSTASHELKTPLTVIAGFAATLTSSRSMSADRQRDALLAIHRRATELNRIVDRLLLSSRIEAGRVDVSCTTVDVGPLVAEAADAVAASTGRILDLSLPSSLPTAYADQGAVVTALEHLIENAAKYSPHGGTIRIAVTAEDDAVTISVADDGIGMDAETVAHCFDKFWQGDQSGTRRFGGTGIGLYIVRSMLDAMGAAIDVDSTLGGGTTFVVRLPRSAGAPLTRTLQGEVTAAPAPPEQRSPVESSSIVEFMRQIGVRPPGGDQR